jgi:uncharacterized protein YaiI (UPF0178 family)
MRLFIDADGCPVVNQSVEIAKKNHIEAVIVKNHAHQIRSDYAEVVTVDKSRDSADYYIVNHASKGDIIVTQDYGLAAMALSKQAYVITQNGLFITPVNIDQLLESRHINQVMRRKHKVYTHHKKRESAQDTTYIKALETLISQIND